MLFIPTHLGAALLCASQLIAAQHDGAAAHQKPIAAPLTSGGVGRQGEKDKESPLTKEFDKRVEELLEQWHVPGLAIGIVDGDETWTKGYGIATYPSTPVTPSTLFYCASTSKAFTAAALSLMISSGNYTNPSLPFASAPKLDWTTPIAQLIPDDFVLLDDWATAHLTLEDALSHRTGLPRHDKASTHRIAGENRTATIRDGVRFLRYLPLNAAPRTKWQYCNQMFVVATHVIETLTGGRWLGDVLREWIWTPLGMQSTYFSLEDALAAPEHFASGYSWSEEEGSFAKIEYMPTNEIGGAGAVVSNVEDYTRWLRMLLREEAPLSKEGHAAIKTPRIVMEPGGVLASLGREGDEKPAYDFPTAYSLGWMVGSYRGHLFWTHAGGMHAYGAEVFFFPDLDFGVVAFGNTAGTSNHVEQITVWQLVDDKLGVPEEERYDWSAKFKSSSKKLATNLANATDRCYPSRPSQPLPPSLPLSSYSGTYFHPGYLNFTLQRATDPEVQTYLSRDSTSFVALRRDATWPTINEFEHVSGEYYIMLQRRAGLESNPAGVTEYAPVQFRVGADGAVEAMGVTWLQVTGADEDVVEGLVWFDKIK